MLRIRKPPEVMISRRGHLQHELPEDPEALEVVVQPHQVHDGHPAEQGGQARLQQAPAGQAGQGQRGEHGGQDEGEKQPRAAHARDQPGVDFAAVGAVIPLMAMRQPQDQRQDEQVDQECAGGGQQGCPNHLYLTNIPRFEQFASPG